MYNENDYVDVNVRDIKSLERIKTRKVGLRDLYGPNPSQIGKNPNDRY